MYTFKDFKSLWGKKLFCLQYHGMILVRTVILNFKNIGNLTLQLRIKLRISTEGLTYFAGFVESIMDEAGLNLDLFDFFSYDMYYMICLRS